MLPRLHLDRVIWLLALLPVSSSSGSASETIPVADALATIEANEQRLHAASWVSNLTYRQLADPHNPNSVLPEDVPTYCRERAVVEFRTGRYRIEVESVSPWSHGLDQTGASCYLHVSDGLSAKHAFWFLPGTKLPKTNKPAIKAVVNRDPGTLVPAATDSIPPPNISFPSWNLLGKPLSELINERQQANQLLEIQRKEANVWLIRIAEDLTSPDVILSIHYDLAKGGLMTHVAWSSVKAPERAWQELRVEPIQLRSGFWVAKTTERINFLNSSLWRTEYSDIVINPPLSNDLFAYEFPKGTRVVDHIRGMVYTSGRSVADVNEAMERYVQHQELMIKGGEDPSVRNRWRYLRYALYAILGLLGIWAARWIVRHRHKQVFSLFSVLAVLQCGCGRSESEAIPQQACRILPEEEDEPGFSTTPCGLHAAFVTLKTFAIPYSPRDVALALPPTRDGISLNDLQACLQAYGLRAELRAAVTRDQLINDIPEDTVAIFPVAMTGRADLHYLLAMHHAVHGRIVMDPPQRPLPLERLKHHRDWSLVHGVVLFVQRDPGAASQPPQVDCLDIHPTKWELGRFSNNLVNSGDPDVFPLTIKNKSDRPVIVSRLESSCGLCLRGFPGGLIRPGEQIEAQLHVIRLSWGDGRQTRSVGLRMADGSSARLEVSGEAFQTPSNAPVPLFVADREIRFDLDEVAPNARQLAREVRVFSSESVLDTLQIRCEAPWCEAKLLPVGPSQRVLQVAVQADAPLDTRNQAACAIRLETNNPEQSTVVRVVAYRLSRWRASPGVIVTRGHDDSSPSITLEHRDGPKVSLESIRCLDTQKRWAVTAVSQTHPIVILIRPRKPCPPGTFVIPLELQESSGRVETLYVVHQREP